MPGNLPGDDMSALNPVEDTNTSSKDKLTPEQKELFKIGKSANWSIIKDYMLARIEIYQKGLFGEDLTSLSTEIIGQRFLAAQSVVAEFQSLIDQIDGNVEVVEDAINEG